jgi:hypothetical protein
MGFAQEMKDFVGAYQATSDVGVKQRAQTTNEQALELDKAYKESLMANKAEELRLRKAAAATRAAVAGSKANDKSNEEEGAAIADSIEVPSDSPTLENPYGYARGGLVVKQYAADGALMGTGSIAGSSAALDPENPPTAVPVTPAPVPAPAPAATQKPATVPPLNQAIPAAATAPEGNPTVVKMMPAPNLPTVQKLDPDNKAILGQVAKSYVYDATKPTAALGPGSDGKMPNKNVKDMKKLPLEEFNVLGNTVDPEGKLPEHQRNAAIFGLSFTTQKDPEAKFKLSYGVLASLQEQSQILGSLIPNALEAGHVNEVCRLFNDACAKFPIGHEIQVTPAPHGFAYVHLDENGKEVEKGELTPEQLLQASGAIANGSAFVDQVGSFFGENKTTGGSYDKALDNVSAASQKAASAAATYKAAVANNAPAEEIQALYDAWKSASEAIPTASSDVERLGGMQKKPLTKRQINADKRAALATPSNEVVPAPPAATKNATAPESGAYTDALTGVTKATSKYAALKAAYDQAIGTDGEKAAAQAVNAAVAEFEAAQKAARDVFGKMERGKTNQKDWEASFNNSLTNAIQIGMNPNVPMAIPTDATATTPAATPVPAVTSGGKPLDAATLANAKTAIAKGASRDAVIKKITDAGFSAEGL